MPVPPSGSAAIDINTTGTVPTLADPGQPQNIFGRVLVSDNEIDVSGGTSTDTTLGIVIFSVGQTPDNEADIYVVGNKISNTTQTAINLRRIGGRAYLEGNEIVTGPVSGPSSPPEVIRAVNTGSYVIAHNTIQCEWPDPQAVGIGVFSQIASWPMEQAVVADNSVTMSPPPDVPFTGLSAGIDVRGFANGNLVTNNRIRGRARAALALDFFKSGGPVNNTLIHNDVNGFVPLIADVVIGSGVVDTLLLGPLGTIQDDGTIRSSYLSEILLRVPHCASFLPNRRRRRRTSARRLLLLQPALRAGHPTFVDTAIHMGESKTDALRSGRVTRHTTQS